MNANSTLAIDNRTLSKVWFCFTRVDEPHKIIVGSSHGSPGPASKRAAFAGEPTRVPDCSRYLRDAQNVCVLTVAAQFLPIYVYAHSDS